MYIKYILILKIRKMFSDFTAASLWHRRSSSFNCMRKFNKALSSDCKHFNFYFSLTWRTYTRSLYPRSKVEFEQDLPSCTGLPDNSVYWPDPMVQYVVLTRLTCDRGQFSLHSPVRGLTMTTPMARSDFLQYPAYLTDPTDLVHRAIGIG